MSTPNDLYKSAGMAIPDSKFDRFVEISTKHGESFARRLMLKPCVRCVVCSSLIQNKPFPRSAHARMHVREGKASESTIREGSGRYARWVTVWTVT